MKREGHLETRNLLFFFIHFEITFLVSRKQTDLDTDCCPRFVLVAPFLPRLALSSPVLSPSSRPLRLALSQQTKAANETLTRSLMIEFISRAQ